MSHALAVGQVHPIGRHDFLRRCDTCGRAVFVDSTEFDAIWVNCPLCAGRGGVA